MTPPKPPLGLRQRLMLALMVPLTAVFAIGVILDYRLAKETADAAFDQSLADAALDIASHIQASEGDLDVELSSEAEAMLRSDGKDHIYFAVRDGDGRLLAGDRDLVAGEAAADGQMLFIDSRFRDGWTRAVVHRVDAATGPITITVAETLSKRNRASRKILTAMILPNLIVIVGTLLAVYLGVRRGLRPLDEVEEAIATRSPRDLREIDTTETPREIRPLVARLNDLFGLLREAAAGQQRFLADAAHQLRTPLAGLQTQIELATVEGRFQSDPERLASIEEATGRIAHLVDQLLVFARSEPAAAATQIFEPVPLDLLLEKAASIFLDRALSKGIDLGFDIAPVTVNGIPWMLREALTNLIDNALRYTPGGGTITVRSSRREGNAVLEVEDNGPGIPAEEQEKIFDRFYRIPGTAGEGCGLGLTIVREIAHLHGAEVRLATLQGGGLRISLMFPVTDGAH